MHWTTHGRATSRVFTHLSHTGDGEVLAPVYPAAETDSLGLKLGLFNEKTHGWGSGVLGTDLSSSCLQP